MEKILNNINEEYEIQPLTDPDVQEDFILIRNKDDELERVEVSKDVEDY